jgi:hypothetical protein
MFTKQCSLSNVSTTLKIHRVSLTSVDICHRWQIFPPFWLALLIPVANIHRCQWYWRQICYRCQRCRWQIATGINNTGGKFATSGKQWGQLSNCWQLKWTLKKFFLLYANSSTQRCPKEIINIFLNKDFFHLPPVSLTPVANLELRIS